MAIATDAASEITAGATVLEAATKRYTVPFDLTSADITALQTDGIITINGTVDLPGIDGATYLYITLSDSTGDLPENPA